MLASFADENFSPTPFEWCVYTYVNILLLFIDFYLILFFFFFVFDLLWSLIFFFCITIGGSGKSMMACDVIGTSQLKSHILFLLFLFSVTSFSLLTPPCFALLSTSVYSF